MFLSNEGDDGSHEVFPHANATVLEHLRKVDTIVYGMGSLYTSICPSLVLAGVGEQVAASPCSKVLILNSSYDRETSGMTASCVVQAVCNALNRVRDGRGSGREGESETRNGTTHTRVHVRARPLAFPCASYITTVIGPMNGAIPMDDRLYEMGVERVLLVPTVKNQDGLPFPVYCTEALVQAIADESLRTRRRLYSVLCRKVL